MIFLQLVTHFIFLALFLFLISFLFASVNEHRNRAVYASIASSLITVTIWAAIYLFLFTNQTILIAVIITTLMFLILFFAPVGSLINLKIVESNQKIDERDTIFAREDYHAGTERYIEYYNEHPDYKSVDDRLKELPALLSPGGKFYDLKGSIEIKEIFKKIGSMTTSVDGEVALQKREDRAENFTKEIKKKIIDSGASDVGIALLEQRYVYSHVGRGPEPWGQQVENSHKFAIIFTLEMSYHQVEKAPTLPITTEAAIQYLKGAEISIEIAKYIRSIGFQARAHISDSNYQIMLPPLAYQAGLGELGRMGYLISPKQGARIRLGAITTELPLIIDKPINFGVQDFCEKCMKCADNCPSQAIAHNGKKSVRGVEKWLLNVEQCLHYWRIVGTDCGLCMKVCPYSHPPTFVHNIVRAGTRRSSFARTVSVWGDDIFYGKYDKYGRDYT